MKKSIFIPLFVSLVASGCTEDFSQSPAMEHVTMEAAANLTAKPACGAVELSWDLPANEQYYYSIVSYHDSNGEAQSTKVDKYALDKKDNTRVRTVVKGFLDTNEYEFTVKHISFAGDVSAPKVVRCVPLDRSDGKLAVFESIEIKGGEECAYITWDNEMTANVEIEVIHPDFFAKGQPDKTVKFETLLSSEGVIYDLPAETDITLKYQVRDLDTKEATEPEEVTLRVNPSSLDVYNPSVVYVPNSFYGNPNDMTITWNATFNEYTVKTSGGDPYIYTQLPSKPQGPKLVFRYRLDQDLSRVQIFLNGQAPSEAQSAVFTDHDGFVGLRATNGYWRTAVWDMTGDLAKFDFIDGPNDRKFRFDFGSESGRTLEVRNMHFEK